MISVEIESEKFTQLKNKFEKYGPYALKGGLKRSSTYMNTDGFKTGMYPPDKNGQPFMWSSEKQRRFVFANVSLPHKRTMGLARSGKFTVNEDAYWIGYSNSLPWWIYVLHPSYQIIGHRMRNWPTINKFVVDSTRHGNNRILQEFKSGAIDAWKEMETFMFGGGAGL
jgi:hypothetical protein